MKRPDGSTQEGQTRELMLNNLDEFSALVGNWNDSLYRVVGGYTLADEEQLARLNAVFQRFERESRTDELRAALKVGVQEDAEVTSMQRGQTLVNDPGQKVTQVFGSACAIAYNESLSAPQSWDIFGRLILEASYEATFHAALLNATRHQGEHASKVLYLTALGRGVLGNPVTTIAAAIRRACQKFKDVDLDIRIVTYQGRADPLFQELAQEFGC